MTTDGGAGVRGIGGDVEAAVMAVMWSATTPLTVSEACAEVNSRRPTPLARTTVLTVLTNLARKGLLEQHQDGPAYKYTAAVPREQYTAELMSQALEGTDDRAAALLYFVEHLDQEERDALRRIARRGRSKQ